MTFATFLKLLCAESKKQARRVLAIDIAPSGEGLSLVFRYFDDYV